MDRTVNLPPLPETTGFPMPYEHAAEQLRAYATAAVLADREQRSEPVAWRVYFPTEQRLQFCEYLDELCEDLTNLPHDKPEPLYAAPQPVEPKGETSTLRSALQACVKAIHEYRTQGSPTAYWDDVQKQVADALNAAPQPVEQRRVLEVHEVIKLMPESIPARYDAPLIAFARAIEAAHGIEEEAP